MYKHKIGFLWWSNPYAPIEISVLTIQKQALERLGCKVEVFNIETVFNNPDELNRLNDVDLIFTSVMPLVLEDKRYGLIKSPVLFQIDGYGSSTFYDGYCNPLFPKLTEKASLVTFLDMNVYEEFMSSGLKFDYDKIYFVPNGCENLSPEGDEGAFKKHGDEILIGSLMKESIYKEPWHFLEASNIVAKKRPNIRFLYPILGWNAFLYGYEKLDWKKGLFGEPIEYEWRDGYVWKHFKGDSNDIMRIKLSGLPNVDFIQYIPYKLVPAFINSCDVFAHYSSGDAFAKTVTEAFSLGKSPIVSDNVRVQSIETEKLSKVKEFIGEPMPQSYEATKPYFQTGYTKHLHIVPRRNPSLCAEALNWAIDHPKEYEKTGIEVKRWSDEWITWQNKWEHIFGLAEEKKII